MDFYSQLQNLQKSQPLNFDPPTICSKINQLDLFSHQAIWVIILHYHHLISPEAHLNFIQNLEHYSSTNTAYKRLPALPYDGKTFTGLKGARFEFSNLPHDLQELIAIFVEYLVSPSLP